MADGSETETSMFGNDPEAFMRVRQIIFDQQQVIWEELDDFVPTVTTRDEDGMITTTPLISD